MAKINIPKIVQEECRKNTQGFIYNLIGAAVIQISLILLGNISDVSDSAKMMQTVIVIISLFALGTGMEMISIARLSFRVPRSFGKFLLVCSPLGLIPVILWAMNAVLPTNAMAKNGFASVCSVICALLGLTVFIVSTALLIRSIKSKNACRIVYMHIKENKAMGSGLAISLRKRIRRLKWYEQSELDLEMMMLQYHVLFATGWHIPYDDARSVIKMLKKYDGEWRDICTSVINELEEALPLLREEDLKREREQRAYAGMGYSTPNSSSGSSYNYDPTDLKTLNSHPLDSNFKW